MIVIPKVFITDEMKLQAKIEAKKRNPFIKHHFEVKHFTPQQRDILGFLGEFACLDYFNLDYKNNIRKDYKTIDNCDFIYKGKKIDIKTETIPAKHAKKLLRKQIKDNELYSRRLIHIGQVNLLNKYDIVLFGIFVREHPQYWYPLGYIETKTILNNYKPTINRPDGGKYHYEAIPIKNSDLKEVKNLI